MITKRITWRYAPETKKKGYHPTPPFTVGHNSFRLAQAAGEHAVRLSMEGDDNVEVKDAKGVVVFSVRAKNLQEKEPVSQGAILDKAEKELTAAAQVASSFKRQKRDVMLDAAASQGPPRRHK